MKARFAVLLALAAVAGIAPARADIDLFGSYWDNVARAAKANDAAAVRRLLGPEGTPNEVDEEQRTAMHYAAINGNLQIIAILVKARAKLDPKDKLGNTPLHWAADRGQTEALKLLLDVGAPVDPENKNGMTPLMMAASRGNLEIVQALLTRGANAAKTDYTGRDAAGWAVDGHRPAVIQVLQRALAAKRP
jgi:ankyrin repeat protein